VHDPNAQQRLRDRIDDLLGVDPDSGGAPPATEPVSPETR